MANSIDEFKVFVKKYPKLRYEVQDGKRSWQSLYEEWSILGDDGSWDNFKEEKESAKAESSDTEFLKTALNYVKKINPDDISKVIGTVSKVAGIISAFNGSGNKNQQNQIAGPQRRRVDPLFRRFDDYDD